MSRFRRIGPAVAIGVALIHLGCSQGEDALDPELVQVPRGTGVIEGRVTLVGTPPPRRSQFVACDPRPNAPRKEIVDNAVRVSDTGGLADVYVYVVAAAAPSGEITLRGSGIAEEALILDQFDCVFLPNALAIQIGQRLRIRNSDPTFHNVHWKPRLNRTVNFGFTPAPASGERVVAFTHAEFFSVRCDVHPWMTSTIGVFEHPFFAVTDTDGRFQITGLPPGRYTLATYHPHYGDGPRIELDVAPTTPATAELTFTPPTTPGQR